MGDETFRARAIVVDEYTGPLRKMRQELQATTKVPSLRIMQAEWRSVSREVGNVTAGISRGLMPVMQGLGITSLGAGAALYGIAKSFRDFSKNTENLRVFSKEAGVTVDNMRALISVNERFGGSAEGMKAAVDTFANNMLDLRRRWGESYGALRGMNLGSLAEELISAPGNQEAITRAIEGLAKIGDPQVRRRVSLLLFGTADISTIAGEVGDKIRETLQAAQERLGKTSKEQLEAVEKFENNLRKLQDRLEGLKTNVLGPMMGMINDTSDFLNKTPGQAITEGNKPAGGEARLRGMRRDKAQLEGLLGMETDAGGDPAKIADMRRRLEKLTDEIKRLTDEIEKSRQQGQGGLQKQSFEGGSITDQARVIKASLGGFSGGGGGFDGSMIGNAIRNGGGGSGGGRGLGGLGGAGGEGVTALPDNMLGTGIIDRTRFSKELESNPALKNKIMAIAAGENNDKRANISVYESMMNRAAMSGTSLAAQARLHASSGVNEGGYYAGYKPGALNDPKRRAILEKNLATALAGSNVSNYATDNASGGLAAGERASGKFTYQSDSGRETFFSPGWGGGKGGPRSRAAYERWRSGLASAQDDKFGKGTAGVEHLGDSMFGRAMDSGVVGGGAQKITGSAAIDITLNGFPSGTRTRQETDGLFDSVKINRAPAMPDAAR